MNLVLDKKEKKEKKEKKGISKSEALTSHVLPTAPITGCTRASSSILVISKTRSSLPHNVQNKKT